LQHGSSRTIIVSLNVKLVFSEVQGWIMPVQANMPGLLWITVVPVCVSQQVLLLLYIVFKPFIEKRSAEKSGTTAAWYRTGTSRDRKVGTLNTLSICVDFLIS
jgi:hypothetical protein